MEITFPASRSCLWNEEAIGETTELHLTTSGWIQLKLNSNVIDMALQHSFRQSCESEAWLIATSVVKKNYTICIEVNRFDPGKMMRFSEDDPLKLHPTIILSGDIPIHCRVVNRLGSNEGVLTHNMTTLQNAFSLLDQRLCSVSLLEYTLMMSLRVIMIRNDNHMITIKGGCVMPSSLFQLSPINKIPLLPISLSRNLMAPKLQSAIRVGYLSMDKCRKLVPLLQSDKSVHKLPLVGIWISGVNEIDHPGVWSACLHYISTASPIDRVYGTEEENSFLVLLPGKENRLWQCSAESTDEWAWHIGESTYRLTSLANSLVLMPCLEESAEGTLLESAMSQWKKNRGIRDTKEKDHNDSLPCSSPAPSPVSVPSFVSHDSDLSCLSEINTSSHEGSTPSHKGVTSPHKEINPSHEGVTSPHEETSPSHEGVTSPNEGITPTHKSKMLREQCTNTSFSEQSSTANHLMLLDQEVKRLREQVKCLLEKENSKEADIQTTPTNMTTPTNTVATNTGTSLLERDWPPILNYDRSISEDVPSYSSQTSYSTNHSADSNSGTLTPPASLPIMASSVMSENILPRDLTSPECSCSGSFASEETVISDKEENERLFCQGFQCQVDDLLGIREGSFEFDNPSVEHSGRPLLSLDEGDIDHPYTDFNATSFIDIPRIKYSLNELSVLSSETTMDTKSNLADVIARRYVTTPTDASSHTSAAEQYSIATQDYLTRHGLARNTDCPTNINIKIT